MAVAEGVGCSRRERVQPKGEGVGAAEGGGSGAAEGHSEGGLPVRPWGGHQVQLCGGSATWLPLMC